MKELEQASLFDLYRLKEAINSKLDDPERIDRVRRHLSPGDDISYFDAEKNRLVKATVEKLHRTRLVVRNKEDRCSWDIRFCMVNLDGVDTSIHSVHEGQKLDRTQLQVGGFVAFKDKQNVERVGEIVRLNQKTVTLKVNGREKWRVSYSLLSKVVDGETGTVADGVIELPATDWKRIGHQK
ncbi:hypothetical protein ACQZV8_07330 [Magnetococcales bacterium HHB-1]